MSIINITDITVLSTTARFADPYRFKITFECIAELKDGTLIAARLRDCIKVIFDTPQISNGSSFTSAPRRTPAMIRNLTRAWSVQFPSASTASSSRYGVHTPASRALYSRHTQATAPLPSQIPPSDLIGVTVILLTASYADQEFVRVGYYVNTEYETEELKLQDPPPQPPLYEKLVRSVLADKPRVTRFNVKWCGMSQWTADLLILA
jgi:histone chaperone ASF1